MIKFASPEHGQESKGLNITISEVFEWIGEKPDRQQEYYGKVYNHDELVNKFHPITVEKLRQAITRMGYGSSDEQLQEMIKPENEGKRFHFNKELEK